MKLRKQWSCKYQVVELEEEVEDLEMANTIGTLMEDIAKTQLEKMIETTSSLDSSVNANKSVAVNNYSSNGGFNPISPKQATTIKKQFKRAVGIAKNLGISLNNESDVDNLSKENASKIINEFFKNSNSAGF